VIAAARETAAAGAFPKLEDIARSAGVSRATVHRLFGSRGDLLRLLDVEPDPSARERVLAQAMTMLEEQGLARLSMEELAGRATLSRASLYRLFPGKEALFRELVRLHAPLLAVSHTLAELGDRPADEVMPAIALALVGHLEGRVGLFRVLLLDVLGAAIEAEAARELARAEVIVPLAGYLLTEMSAGRLRPMHPLLALQAFAGPLIFHVLSRPLAERLLGFTTPIDSVAIELAAAWVRAMQPSEGGA
jgi:AcrR family transcriptional regulator